MENYKWALEQLKLTLKESMHPRVIVTDRELALMKACAIVFPRANHLLCRWHISQNILRNHKKSFRKKREWIRFQWAWKLLINSPTWISYDENYEILRTSLSQYPRVLRYVHENWLDKYKNHFVSASIDQCLNFGNRTSNRVESQHAKLKNYMQYHSYTLDKFVICIDKIVKSQLAAIKESFGRSEISRYRKHNIPCFSYLRGFVSNEALDLMVKEINRLDDSQLDSSTCGCQLHSSCGLPCACRLSFYVNSGEFIPLNAIDIFWRTLKISPTTYFQSDTIRCETEVNQFKEQFKNQSEPGKRSFLRKLVDIFNPSKTTMKPPTVRRNTRGRPSLKKQQQQQKRHAPPKNTESRARCQSTRFFGVDLNFEPGRHSSYTNYQNEEPARNSMFSDLNEESARNSMFSDLNEESARHSMFMDLNEEPARHNMFMDLNEESARRSMFLDLNEEPARHSMFADLNEDPARHSTFLDLNEEPARHSMFADLNEVSTRHSMFVDLNTQPARHRMFVDLNEVPNLNPKILTNPLLYHIPDIFHPYIRELNNVKGDGNCGFRSVAVAVGRDENMWPLVRQELLQELRNHMQYYMDIFTSNGFEYIWKTVDFSGTGIAPREKWMSMPDTGFVIASFYRRPVVFISMVGSDVLSSTCFPLWSDPHESESTNPIVIARVNEIHFINLLLREGFPIPSTHPQWKTYRTYRASAWEDMFSSRQLAFEEYIRSRRQM